MHNRRTFLLHLAALATTPLARADGRGEATSATASLTRLETELDGRLGLFALDTGSGAQLSYRADERFPMCSTFKVMLAAAILQRSAQADDLLQQRIRYQRSDLVNYSPVTEQHLADGMTVAGLCAAALQYSDNSASNLLMRMLDGPAGVTAFARSIGDTAFRLDRWETELNSAIPGDLRDTSTPRAMGRSLRRLVMGDALATAQADQLRAWLCGNTTGARRIRAAVPTNWIVGDKTGSGDYGTANDVAVLWPPGRAPIVMAIYTTQQRQATATREDLIAAAALTAVKALASS
ncbi:MAG: class A beta-lactamase [Burkholderiaceae bacterium]|nr:class A beta-lactamase [Burkholderiaceae bacterium]